MIRDPRLRRWACALLLLAGPAVPGAWATEVPATPPARPTRVAVKLFFNSVENVSSIDETFNADFYLRLGWSDPGLARLSPGQIEGRAIWQPKVELVNSRDFQQLWEPYFEFPAPGELYLFFRFNGTFSAPMDLHDFPFDRQVLPIEIESLGLPSNQMVLVHSVRPEKGSRIALLKPEEVGSGNVRLPEWDLEGIRVREIDKYYSFVDATYSRYRIEILVSRRSGFYVWKVIAIEAMIVVLSWAVFLLAAGEVGNRLAVSVTLLLATVAFSYVVGGITPRVSYQTLLDWFLLGCFALIFLSAVEAVAVYFLHRREKGAATAAKVDRWSLAAFPVAFLLLNLLLWVPALV